MHGVTWSTYVSGQSDKETRDTHEENKYAPNKFKDIHKSKTPTFIYA
jgi:hypothetical protein